ncbi:rubrerythrin family protein, partial [Rhizobium laguerreae]|nr:rubrerythrin family protein [Rhizobium laguerreae]MBY3384053.1 rubrerythrin family protein [Rhizobium laguerreae]
MVTMVGNESDIKGLVTDLIYLEHDAIAAYDSCIARLDNKKFASQI